MNADSLNWGVLGTGFIAQKALIPVLQRLPRTRLLAIASQDEPRARASAARFGIPRAYGSYAALLADPDIQCVYIALPNDLHQAWTLRAAAAGKHVLCEKPLALSLAELDAMEAACAAAGVRLMEALMYRFHPRMERLRALLDANTIGPVRDVVAAFSFPLTAQTNYRLDPSRGGGALWDVGGYCVHAARHALLGAEPVAAQAAARYGPSGTDEQLAGLLEFSDGRTAQIACGFRMAEQQHITIVGASGVLEIPHPAFTAWHGDPAPILLRHGADVETLACPSADPYELMAAAFSDAIRNGTPVPYPLAETRATLRAVLALGQAARTGARVVLDG
jgi:predicted dehydrogenase